MTKTVAELITGALQRHGLGTMTQLCVWLGGSRRSAIKSTLMKMYKADQLHVPTWRLEPCGSRKVWTPVYALGAGENAFKPMPIGKNAKRGNKVWLQDFDANPRAGQFVRTVVSQAEWTKGPRMKPGVSSVFDWGN